MVVGERPRVRQIEAAEATGRSVTLRVRPPRTASELDGSRSLKGGDDKVGVRLRDLLVGDGGGVDHPRRRPEPHLVEQLVDGARGAAVGAVEEEHLEVALREPGHLRLAGGAAIGDPEARHGQADAALGLHEDGVEDEARG